ncbi:hypothetical protein CC80DRAFT_480405 [Byssothecium circinans]|uniref:Uncharacterized protein n=1 Tax=Byssothecium circinans TaxID=147558 RepID=A0A6A5TH62_9PLEO|nr:hypothetical protein CC80DRAFT_480405 [Byssothecium circinans]
MQSLRRTAASAARKGRTTLPRQPRRYAHDEHAHGHSHAPVSEPIGSGFWITVGSIPAAGLIYYVSRSDDPNAPPFLTRMINKYTEADEKLTARNALHVQMMEKAGADKVLFKNSTPQEHVPMKFPEIMNVGSPYNVPAGSQVNMDKVIEKFRREANEDNERKLEALRNGTLKVEQPFEKKWVN